MPSLPDLAISKAIFSAMTDFQIRPPSPDPNELVVSSGMICVMKLESSNASNSTPTLPIAPEGDPRLAEPMPDRLVAPPPPTERCVCAAVTALATDSNADGPLDAASRRRTVADAVFGSAACKTSITISDEGPIATCLLPCKDRYLPRGRLFEAGADDCNTPSTISARRVRSRCSRDRISNFVARLSHAWARALWARATFARSARF